MLLDPGGDRELRLLVLLKRREGVDAVVVGVGMGTVAPATTRRGREARRGRIEGRAGGRGGGTGDSLCSGLGALEDLGNVDLLPAFAFDVLADHAARGAQVAAWKGGREGGREGVR